MIWQLLLSALVPTAFATDNARDHRQEYTVNIYESPSPVSVKFEQNPFLSLLQKPSRSVEGTDGVRVDVPEHKYVWELTGYFAVPETGDYATVIKGSESATVQVGLISEKSEGVYGFEDFRETIPDIHDLGEKRTCYLEDGKTYPIRAVVVSTSATFDASNISVERKGELEAHPVFSEMQQSTGDSDKRPAFRYTVSRVPWDHDIDTIPTQVSAYATINKGYFNETHTELSTQLENASRIVEIIGHVQAPQSGTYDFVMNAEMTAALQIGGGSKIKQQHYRFDDSWHVMDSRCSPNNYLRLDQGMFYPFRIVVVESALGATWDLHSYSPNNEEVDLFGLWEIAPKSELAESGGDTPSTSLSTRTTENMSTVDASVSTRVRHCPALDYSTISEAGTGVPTGTTEFGLSEVSQQTVASDGQSSSSDASLMSTNSEGSESPIGLSTGTDGGTTAETSTSGNSDLGLDSTTVSAPTANVPSTSEMSTTGMSGGDIHLDKTGNDSDLPATDRFPNTKTSPHPTPSNTATTTDSDDGPPAGNVSNTTSSLYQFGSTANLQFGASVGTSFRYVSLISNFFVHSESQAIVKVDGHHSSACESETCRPIEAILVKAVEENQIGASARIALEGSVTVGESQTQRSGTNSAGVSASPSESEMPESERGTRHSAHAGGAGEMGGFSSKPSGHTETEYGSTGFEDQSGSVSSQDGQASELEMKTHSSKKHHGGESDTLVEFHQQATAGSSGDYWANSPAGRNHEVAEGSRELLDRPAKGAHLDRSHSGTPFSGLGLANSSSHSAAISSVYDGEGSRASAAFSLVWCMLLTMLI